MGNSGFETFGTNEIGSDPDGFEGFQELRLVVDGLWSRLLFARWFPVNGFIGVQLGDRVLAVVVTDLAELREDPGFIFSRSFLVALGNAFEVFPFRN